VFPQGGALLPLARAAIQPEDRPRHLEADAHRSQMGASGPVDAQAPPSYPAPITRFGVQRQLIGGGSSWSSASTTQFVRSARRLDAQRTAVRAAANLRMWHYTRVGVTRPGEPALLGAPAPQGATYIPGCRPVYPPTSSFARDTGRCSTVELTASPMADRDAR
jgi:hypothetical protein